MFGRALPKPLPQHGASMYTGNFRWMVPLMLGLITTFNLIMIICAIVIVANHAEYMSRSTSDNNIPLQAFFWCTLPSVFLILNVIESFLRWRRLLHPVEVVITSSISLFFCLALMFMWIFRGFAGPLGLYPNMRSLPLAMVCLAALTAFFYIIYLALGIVTLRREKKANGDLTRKTVDQEAMTRSDVLPWETRSSLGDPPSFTSTPRSTHKV